MLPTGARATFLAQVGQLTEALGTVRSHFNNVTQATGCSSHGPSKTCILLLEIRAVLQSAEREILHTADTLATMVRAPAGPRAAGVGGGHPGGAVGCAGLVGWDMPSTASGWESLELGWVQPCWQRSQEDVFPLLAPVCNPLPALREVLVGAGLVGSRTPSSPRGSHCFCFHFKEIPREIPQQPTNWSRQALEARELAKRCTCKSDPDMHGQRSLLVLLGVQGGHSFLRRPILRVSILVSFSLQP